MKHPRRTVGKIKSKPNRQRSWAWKLVKVGIYTLAGLALAVAAAGYVVYTHYAEGLPSFESMTDYQPPTVTFLYGDDGEVVGELFVERRIVVPIERMPLLVRQAFMAAEDAEFYSHPGLNAKGILRAIIRNVQSGRMHQGASTITQQTVRALLLNRDRTFSRKMREIILAFRLESRLDKDRILEIYLNHIYLGHGAYGIESAANLYFDKHVEELTLAESALLAGMPKAPSLYNPFVSPESADRRWRYVLRRMTECGFITAEQADEAIAGGYTLKDPDGAAIEKAPYFVEHVRKILIRQFGEERVLNDGLRVYTTLDPAMQAAAEEAVERGLAELESRHPSTEPRETFTPDGNLDARVQAALFAMDVDSGAVRAMVGGRDYETNQYNRAVQAHRQPGSAFKPVVYAAALENGFTPGSVIIDAPVVLEPEGARYKWKPTNFNGQFYGPTDLYTGLTESRNIVAVKLLDKIGIRTGIEYARRLGIESELQPVPPLALGASGVTLAEMVKAYTVFPNLGRRVEPFFITRVEDRFGNIVYENEPVWKIAIEPGTAAVMTSMLQGVVEHGTGGRVKALGRPCAGKTGTTNRNTDAWFVGFTPDHACGVWIGRDDNESLGPGENGGRSAAPIFVHYMREALKDRPVKEFALPPEVETVERDGRSILYKKGTVGKGISELNPPESEFLVLDRIEDTVAPDSAG